MGAKNAIPQRSPGPNSSQWAPGLALVPSTAVSSTDTYISQTFNASNLDNVGLQIAFAGTMVGTISVLCSIDNQEFIPLSFNPSLSQPNGANLSYLINLTQVPYPYIQVQYVNSSGSGTFSVYLSAKDLN